MKVDVYRNLNDDCISIRSRESDNYGIVIDHRDTVVIDDVKFVVQDSGRARVLDEKRKNVHAFARGKLDPDQQWRPETGASVMYNPYKFDSFVLSETHEPVSHADRVVVGTNGVHAVGVEHAQ